MSYLIVGGNQKQQAEKLSALAVKFNWNLSKNNPNLLKLAPVDNKKSIGIARVKQVKEFLSRTGWDNTIKLVLINQAEALTTEAQNALLKTLEEPEGKSELILLASNKTALLPTIISRCQVVNLQTKINQDTKVYKQWLDFVEADWSEKFKLAEKFKATEIDKYILQLQSEMVGNKNSNKIAKWIRVLMQAKDMLESNVSRQQVADWLVLKIGK